MELIKLKIKKYRHIYSIYWEEEERDVWYLDDIIEYEKDFTMSGFEEGEYIKYPLIVDTYMTKYDDGRLGDNYSNLPIKRN